MPSPMVAPSANSAIADCTKSLHSFDCTAARGNALANATESARTGNIRTEGGSGIAYSTGVMRNVAAVRNARRQVKASPSMPIPAMAKTDVTADDDRALTNRLAQNNAGMPLQSCSVNCVNLRSIHG